MTRRRAWKVGSALCCVSVVLGPALACGAFDESTVATTEGPDGSTDGDRGEAASDGSGALVDGRAAGDGGPDPLTDAQADGDAGTGPIGFAATCLPQDTAETESNNTAALGNPFASSACGTLTSTLDLDYLTFTIKDTAGFTVAFACTGDARFMISLPTGSYTSGNNSAGSFETKTFPGVATPPHTYTIKISGSDLQDWRLVVKP